MSLPTIKASSDISSIFSRGDRISNRYVTFIFTARVTEEASNRQHDLDGRVAFIAGKRNGNAVWRNAAKRRMREVYLRCKENIAGYDILFVAKPRIMTDSYSKVLRACQRSLDELAGREPSGDTNG